LSLATDDNNRPTLTLENVLEAEEGK